jgi:hypothetical protein
MVPALFRSALSVKVPTPSNVISPILADGPAACVSIKLGPSKLAAVYGPPTCCTISPPKSSVSASGVALKQNPSALTLSAITGAYAFALVGGSGSFLAPQGDQGAQTSPPSPGDKLRVRKIIAFAVERRINLLRSKSRNFGRSSRGRPPDQRSVHGQEFNKKRFYRRLELRPIKRWQTLWRGDPQNLLFLSRACRKPRLRLHSLHALIPRRKEYGKSEA